MVPPLYECADPDALIGLVAYSTMWAIALAFIILWDLTG